MIQHFTDNKIDFSPAYVCSDVSQAVESIHSTKLLHKEIVSNLHLYLHKHPHLGSFLSKLRDAGKQVFSFLLSKISSMFSFVRCSWNYYIVEYRFAVYSVEGG